MSYKKLLNYTLAVTIGYGLVFSIMWLGGGDFVRGKSLATAFTLGAIGTFIVASEGKVMFKSEVLEVIRLAYLAGIDDTQEGCPRWCNQGSKERAEELLLEFNDAGEVTGVLD